MLNDQIINQLINSLITFLKSRFKNELLVEWSLPGVGRLVDIQHVVTLHLLRRSHRVNGLKPPLPPPNHTTPPLGFVAALQSSLESRCCDSRHYRSIHSPPPQKTPTQLGPSPPLNLIR